jgi:hypothetical protein
MAITGAIKMIDDDTFRIELDRHMKACGLKKAERSVCINNAMMDDPSSRNDLLDDWKAQAHEAKATARIPTEAEEQKAFVEWFRKTYPNDEIILIRNDGSRTPAEKVEQMAMGLCPGASDLFIPRWGIWLEMKRTKGSVWGEKQKDFCEYVLSLEVNYRYIVGYGFDDAKAKVLAIINDAEV